MNSSSAPPTLIDVAAIAALTFIVACTSHEVLGHGATCVAQGGRITLLSSVYFHCENGGVMTDLAGPSVNLLLGLGAYALLARRTWPSNLHLVLVLTMAFNLFWLAGCMLVSALANKSDFAYALSVLAINPPWLGRAALGTLGLLIYWFGMWGTAKHTAQGKSLVISYAVAGIVSCGAALFFVGPVAPAVREAALESFGSAIGLLLLAHGMSRRSSHSSLSMPSSSGYGWLAAGVLATVAFILLLGRGIVVAGNA
jgi:hypothetical protein